MTILRLMLRCWDAVAPPRRLHIIEGDSLPKRLPLRDIVLARDDQEDWCVGMRCPCRCGRHIELLVIAEAKPRWDVEIDAKGRPTLFPSIWLKNGCRSHFWIQRGKVKWCD